MFYLGTHIQSWIWDPRRTGEGVPLFVSRRRLARIKRYAPALERWALDSGGFTEIQMHGKWTIPPSIYAREVERWDDEIGKLDFASIQDWMCEPHMIAKTGKSIKDHQTLTVSSYLDLLSLSPSLPWLPVLQGWTRGDYLEHVEMYARAGIALEDVDRVGLGSVCRRQHTGEVESLIRTLTGGGIDLHAFGFKVLGLARSGSMLASSDSMAWSYRARRSPPLPGCRHKSCANCHRFALRWRARLLATPTQLLLL